MKRYRRLRAGYCLLFTVLLAVETLIALYVHDDFIRPYIGDLLVVILIYGFVRMFIPVGCRLLFFYVFLFAAGVEVLQFFRLAERLGFSGNRAAQIIMGSVFDWKDILCYGIGCGLVGMTELMITYYK